MLHARHLTGIPHVFVVYTRDVPEKRRLTIRLDVGPEVRIDALSTLIADLATISEIAGSLQRRFTRAQATRLVHQAAPRGVP